jgi:glycosyltransferase involved in cell wall biosynthesis
MTDNDLVSVIVPAYNAAETLDETLRSIRSQTHREIEILVVDDGSKDATVEIAQRHAEQDPRLRLISQENAGVAAARNRGIAESKGEVIAPVDADDLWSPDKIERQLRALREGGERVGLVYAWYAHIDSDGNVRGMVRPMESGDVLEPICFGNFVGNGSSALMRKSAVLEAGGYDPSLRARKAQGCEDFLLYFRIAEKYHFALVADSLTGYRQLPNNMSSDHCQMHRSWVIVGQEMHERHPELSREITAGGIRFTFWLLERAYYARRWRHVLRLTVILLGPQTALQFFGYPLLRRATARAWRRVVHVLERAPTVDQRISPVRFTIGDPGPVSE